jgi:hypothetical protein
MFFPCGRGFPSRHPSAARTPGHLLAAAPRLPTLDTTPMAAFGARPSPWSAPNDTLSTRLDVALTVFYSTSHLPELARLPAAVLHWQRSTAVCLRTSRCSSTLAAVPQQVCSKKPSFCITSMAAMPTASQRRTVPAQHDKSGNVQPSPFCFARCIRCDRWRAFAMDVEHTMNVQRCLPILVQSHCTSLATQPAAAVLHPCRQSQPDRRSRSR